MTSDVLIVGASASGLTVADTLRQRGFTGKIRLVGDEQAAPYDRPPLSKQVLNGSWSTDQIELRSSEELNQLDAEFIHGTAVSVDPAKHQVRLEGGELLGYETLVLATGLQPKLPPPWRGIDGVHTLHTVEDSLALRASIDGATDVVVVGAGVLGSEVAATARQAGKNVTIVDMLPTSMIRQLGAELGGLVQKLHEKNGVDMRMNAGISGFVSEDGRVAGVDLGDTVIPAQVVAVCIGGAPRVEWLQDADGIVVSDGIEADSQCRVAEDVYAVGDITRWYHDGLGAMIRLENRTNATEQAMAVARNILGEDVAYTPIPYFWTDQYDVKVQAFGMVRPESTVEFIEGSPEEGRFVAVASSDGVADAVVGWNHPRGIRVARKLLEPRFLSATLAAS